MGYRSDVAYVIAGTNDDVMAFLVQCRMAHSEVQMALDECTVGKLDEDHTYIGFAADDVKWYPSFEGVASHEALWNLASEQDKFEGVRCRIGEDSGDVLEENFGDGSLDLWSYVSISRQVHVDINLGPEHDIRESVKEKLCATTPT